MRTRICTGTCGLRLPEDEIHFALRDRAKGLFRNECKTCYNHKKVQVYRKDIVRKKASLAQLKTRLRNRTVVLNYLDSHPCLDCGESDPVVLEFDHVRGEKFRNISWLVLHRSSIDLIEQEIEKCDVVCANCHRRRTAERAEWYSQYENLP